MKTTFNKPPGEVEELDITLIRATNYTDDGYPIRTRKGVIRSNTLTQMATLVRDLPRYPFFKDLSIKVNLIDEAVQLVPLKRILKRSRVKGVKVIVLMVGVQTCQYPRALDIANWFLPHGIPVLIGGFHVSGMLSMIGQTKDLTAAMDKGVILVAGEVEGDRLPTIIEEVVLGRARKLYNYLNPTPDLTDLPVPLLTREDLKHFASPFSTIDSGRGCVYTCKFCTIINVQGKIMRYREPAQIKEFVRQNYHSTGISHCFFTDDNMARNPRCRELFGELAELREEEGIPFTFMMQADLAARRIKPGNFFELAARAGCNQVFLGLETMNPLNLRAESKYQNRVGDYADLVQHCNSLGITCHAGYIIGFEFDTRDSIREDIEKLKGIGFNSASFYIITPLPGSEDHQTWYREGKWMHPDFNTYDSNHVAVLPKSMSVEELAQTHQDVWEWFYTTEHMASVLKGWRENNKHYWGQLFFYAWYLYASRIERLHPMNCGFWTVRQRKGRRPGFPREAFIPFWWGRAVAAGQRLSGLVKLFFQLEEVWLRSRPESKAEQALHELMVNTRKDFADWRDVTIGELAALYRKLHADMPDVRIPSGVSLWLKKHIAWAHSRMHADYIWRHWYKHFWNPFSWMEVWLFEIINGSRFLLRLLTEGTR
ncbi:MAG: radical SAM protein [Candidatus Veblenbacteria bacterium]|nr:radical SAM protein [Candidatus Veblenbacteria bacterium]